MSPIVVSEMDNEYLRVIRANVVDFMKHVAATYATKPGRLLDIAPQVHEGARPFFPSWVSIDTFDIDPSSGCTYIGDICEYNEFLPDNSYDWVVCTEVLEHTLRPWDAVQEIWRVLKPGGFLFLSVPFNFRIHGPLPDCWRFTEHGLRALLSRFLFLELNAVETPGRPLMPIHYTVVAKKPETSRQISNSDLSEM
jgi:SAM-dependent methyltransferase